MAPGRSSWQSLASGSETCPGSGHDTSPGSGPGSGLATSDSATCPGSCLAAFDPAICPRSSLAASDPETCPGSGPPKLRLRRLLVYRQQFRQPSMERARGERVPADSGVESLLRLAQAVTKCSLSVTVSRSRCFGLGQCRVAGAAQSCARASGHTPPQAPFPLPGQAHSIDQY